MKSIKKQIKNFIDKNNYKISVAFSSVGICCLILASILIFIKNKGQITELVWVGAYIFCAVLMLGYNIIDECIKRKSGKSIEFLFFRNDIFGLLICSILPSVAIPCLLGGILGWTITCIEILTILLMFSITILWFICRIKKYKNDESVKETTHKTIQDMAMFITLIGISQTDMPSGILKILFIVMGFTYTILSHIIERL